MQAFIPYVQAVGRGEKLKRDLTREEAREAMRLILDGTATPAQIGAFLITQRVKGETADEIEGFVEAPGPSASKSVPAFRICWIWAYPTTARRARPSSPRPLR